MFDIEEFKTNENEAVRQKMWEEYRATNPNMNEMIETLTALNKKILGGGLEDFAVKDVQQLADRMHDMDQHQIDLLYGVAFFTDGNLREHIAHFYTEKYTWKLDLTKENGYWMFNDLNDEDRKKVWDNFLASNPSLEALTKVVNGLDEIGVVDEELAFYILNITNRLLKEDISTVECGNLMRILSDQEVDSHWLDRIGYKMLAQEEIKKGMLVWLMTDGPEGCREGAYRRLVDMASKSEQPFLTEDEIVKIASTLSVQGMKEMGKQITAKLEPLASKMDIAVALSVAMMMDGIFDRKPTDSSASSSIMIPAD